MALIQCPECGKEVSDQASACIHCGYPMEREQKMLPIYALVLCGADYNDANMDHRLQIVTGLPEEAAASLRHQVPVVLKRGLEFDACVALIGQFTDHTALAIIRDSDVDDPVNAPHIPYQPAPLPRAPLSFWGVVGAVVLGIVAVVILLSLF